MILLICLTHFQYTGKNIDSLKILSNQHLLTFIIKKLNQK